MHISMKHSHLKWDKLGAKKGEQGPLR